ncbi:MAG: hypothetical protein IPM69_05860 [Ignavibacteria bacterium]|nr:hypothetical protein [Ignavibacteria bacterium]
MKNLILTIAIILLLSSCHHEQAEVPDNYPKDSTISDISGVPKDSLTFYFPTSIRKDSQVIHIDIDTNELNYYSSGLYCAKEKILYNYYQRHDIYRFTLLRSFYLPVYFTLQKDEDSVWMVVKVLDRQPQTRTMAIDTGSASRPTNHKSKGNSLFERNTTIFINPDRHANINYHQTIKLTLQDWYDFEKLLEKCNFWNTTPQNPEREFFQLHAPVWIIEAHLKHKYWFLIKLDPEGTMFAKAGLFLLEKSGIKSKSIYTQYLD